MKPICEQVVVITGASSGIGRCTALHLADRGARVVLFSRRREALDALAEEIRAGGGEALVVAGDVSRPEDIDRLADATLERFGRIDTWVNNAAVFIQGAIEDVTPEEYRRVLDVNLYGVILGSRRALLEMRRQEEGVIVTISSILGQRGAAYFGAYSTAKAGLRGFSDALRTELVGSNIHASTLFLPSMDTPIYRHARSKFGTVPRPASPVYDPIRAAVAVAELAETGRARMFVSWFHWLYVAFDRISPRLGDLVLHRAQRLTLSEEPSVADTLFEPLDDDVPRVRDGWGQAGWRGFTLRRVVRAMPAESLLAAAAAGFAAAGWRAGRRPKAR